VYDALATDRPYREALPHSKCMEIMREEVRRGWWDGNVSRPSAGAAVPLESPADPDSRAQAQRADVTSS